MDPNGIRAGILAYEVLENVAGNGKILHVAKGCTVELMSQVRLCVFYSLAAMKTKEQFS
jgi:hypothetical protein